ncbi:condensation domain-containing protein [Mesorhizobium dulcispinae]|uniref:condensation domain-containing protein n=1 Tax=Mesorhizobium dulcispinae TaxID=3072316 RepID=UPI002A245A5B|nr:condensation domain-containing protein [Mesorhizobium sp. VK23D]MDX8522781.1 condensation domain-containing protein [Mesorhizobium sp. VK23D]
MKVVRTIQINERNGALSAIPAIETLTRPSRVPLSFSQQRLCFLSRLEGGSEVVNMQIGLRLRGELDEAALQSALDALVARHEVLRTTFGMEDGEPFQQIGRVDVGLPLKRDDLAAAADVEATLSELVRHEGQAKFYIETGPLVRTRLARLAEDDHMLLITVHHIVSDDRSREILIRELSELYAAALEGRADRLTPLSVQYADYAIWQRRWLAGAVLKLQSEYWLRILDGAPAMLQLPTDRMRPAQQDYNGSYVDFVLHEPLSSQIKALCRRHGTTLFVTVLAGLALVLARLSGQNDLVIGTPCTNRAPSEIEGLIGCFAHTLPLRIDLSGDPTLQTLLGRVNAATLEAQDHKDLPFDCAVEFIAPRRKPGQNPPFQVILTWRNNAEITEEMTGLEIEYLDVGARVAQYDLSLNISEVGEAICGRLIYPTSLFERSTMERFVSYLQQALSQMAVDLGQRVWSAPLVSAEEQRLPVESIPTEAASPQDRWMHDLLEAQTEPDPEAITVINKGQSLSDLESNTWATSLAPRICSSEAPGTNSDPRPDTVVMNFIEGPRVVTKGELQASSIMRYHVTRAYREQITHSGYHEQLKFIVEPSFEEFESPGNLDTSGEQDNTIVPGFQHKYAQTGLLLVTNRCASYCRYCLRKRLVGKESDEIAADFARIAQYIRGHPEMTNVLLTGGDPLVLSTAKLDKMLDHLLPIPHLDSIRFGTKTLAYNPKRFEDPALPAFFQRIDEAGKAAVIVTHFDHIGEISVNAERSIRSLRAQGVQFLNQTVLLAKVNDDPEILAATFAKCHQMGIRPYYLFQARPVKGASHFQVSLRRGIEIARGINQRLSGIQKTFKYIMSHHTGKIEILDLGADGRVYMRYHQNKCAEKIGKIFSRPHLEAACWLEDLPEV